MGERKENRQSGSMRTPTASGSRTAATNRWTLLRLMEGVCDSRFCYKRFLLTKCGDRACGCFGQRRTLHLHAVSDAFRVANGDDAGARRRHEHRIGR
jgi:hypothetical protein